ncbi:MAG: adenylate/guanylate cyclase domain-containing protein [Verrucomicrobiota bacterium]
MKLNSFKLVPCLIAGITIGLACFFQSAFFSRHFDFFQRLEWVTYDQRVKAAQSFPRRCSTNLAAVFLDEVTVKVLETSWPYPRQLHGRVVRELAAQGAKAVGFDIIFGELRPLDERIQLPDKSTVTSDDFFGAQMQRAGNVILAAESQESEKNLSAEVKSAQDDQRAFPPPVFATNAMAVGAINAEADSDGILRRAKAFTDDPDRGRFWHLGIILAAKELGLDLSRAVVEPNRLILSSTNGVQRIIPIDDKGFFYIDWCLSVYDERLTRMSYGMLVMLDEARQTGNPDTYRQVVEVFRNESGKTNLLGDSPFKNKLVVVGSTLTGNNLTDRGSTPLHKQDYLVSKHWNVANSIITNQFIRLSSYPFQFLIIVLLGTLAAVLTLQLRAVSASISVVAMLIAYVALTFFLFIQYRLSIPLVIPVFGAALMTHVSMVTYRVRVEQKEKQRVKAVFSKMVSPSIVNEVLNVETLLLGGARRKITVYFADVRGFTEMTDIHQSRAEEYVRDQNLSGAAAEAHFDEQARETLATVNLYLGTIADKVKEHNGTLDKYIGDCVMAFWGAPLANETHALDCVRAAIASQRAMHQLNQHRAVENQNREQENRALIAAGQRPLDMLPLLSLGSGINTGTVVVGMMGSDAHGLNYTVFGREVNLASRLEGVSGRGRIIIGESTFLEIKRDDPQLAATCVELEPEKVKGFRNAVKIYEVPWKIASEDSASPTPQPASVESIKA